MAGSDDPRWVEHARQRGLHLEKVKEGLYIVKKEDAPPEHRDRADKEPARHAGGNDREEAAKQAATE
ncbi:MAG TPA: hypothetical protein VFQ25_10415 [Ktedonobacterales bacterium]|nr:hypothetical protein [Ktedonobacterales bacterium]